MSETRIASRYAKPLLELANEKGCLEEVEKDMAGFSALCESNREFSLMLKNPILNHLKKLGILKKIFKGKVNDMTLSIFELISRKNREQYLPEIAREFHRQYNVFKGVAEASITTVLPLNAELKKEVNALVKKITGKEVELTEKINPEIIGGFILKIGDRQIDDSINSKLNELKLKFSQNLYVNKM
ncbi:MAG: ATP synthase F1 subunit delta [Cyclobacteriaceae bacterium]